MVKQISPEGTNRKALLDEAAQMMARDGLDYQRDIFARGKYYRKAVIKYVSMYPQRAFQLVLAGLRDFWLRAGIIATASEGFRQSVWSKVWRWGYHAIYVLTLVIGLWGASRLGVPRLWIYYFVASALYFMLTAGWAGSYRYRLQVFAFSLPIVVSGATLLIRWWSQRFNPEDTNTSPKWLG
ncbi:MAG: hypothetical protein RMK45_02870 [Armatimonadota bacterium]|nr:hypothetical protein [Armatimonadota bacterium]